MNCPLQSKETSEVLLDYCSRKLNPETSSLLESHIAHCADCRAFADAQKSVWDAMDAWEAVPVSEDFDRRLYAKIEQHENSSWLNKTWKKVWASEIFQPFGWRPAMPVATACLTIIAAVMFYFPSEKPAHIEPNQQVKSEQQVDLDQVESTLDDMEMLRQIAPTPKSRNL
jgi:hypothetical protein